MTEIVLADDGVAFDGTTPETSPLGGAETAFVLLAEALAARGNRVRAFARAARSIERRGVVWAPVEGGLPPAADLYIANRSHHLIAAVPAAARRVLWTHTPCGYMLKMRYLWPLWRVKPVIVFLGDYHASTYPRWTPDGGRAVIPHAPPEAFRTAPAPAETPPPRAIFTSNPLRGLDWLLDQWENRIHPCVPQAELRLFCGPGVYGGAGAKRAARMKAVLARARRMTHVGVRLRAPLARAALMEEMTASRLMLYRGDSNETYCFSVAQAQALGVPAVVGALGAMAERVVDGETGHVARSDNEFAAAAARVLADPAEWRRLRDGALAKQRRRGWAQVAEAFEALV